MTEYNKIDTVFERDMNGTKKLIEGQFRSEAVEYLACCKWRFTEKIDGTNIRVHWDGHKVTFGGRTERANIPAHLMNKLVEIFSNNETEELFEQKFGETEITLYGEGFGAKIQKGGGLYKSDGVDFILFDARVGDLWLTRDSVEDIGKAFNLRVVPVVLRCDIETAVKYVKSKPMSTIGTAPMEGLVGRPMEEMRDRRGNRIIVKLKVRDFE